MKTLLNRWNTIWLRPLTDEEALKVLDGYNKTRYSRRKKKEGLLELASREAHEKQEVYFATILNEDDSPYCAIESNVGYFGVDFLREEDLENFLIYTFRDFTQEGKTLFLDTIRLQPKHPQDYDTVYSFILLSAKLQNATISLSAMPINRRCGLLFGKVSPPFQLSFIGCPLKRENGRHEMWPNVFFKPLRALEYGEFY